MSKTLVAYFSTGGNTRRAAKAIAKAAGAETYEIKPEIPYSHADLNWMDKHSRSTIEMNDAAARPAIVGDLPDLSGVDPIMLGFPIWWYTCPAIIRTFLEALDLKGKKIVPFATSGGSGLGDTCKDLEKFAPGAEILPGRMMNGRLDDAAIAAWVENLKL